MGKGAILKDNMTKKQLTQKQINEFKEQFLQQIETIMNGYKSKKENEIALELDTDGDDTDFVQGNILFSIQEKLSIKHAQKLENIQKALKRIDRGEFGNCVECEDEISKARLLAIPETELCIKCAENQEIELRNFIKNK